jgi:hypothetical protein
MGTCIEGEPERHAELMPEVGLVHSTDEDTEQIWEPRGGGEGGKGPA